MERKTPNLEELSRLLLLSQTLQEVGALLTTRLSLDEALAKLMDLIGRVVQYDSISIQLVDSQGQLHLAAGRGFPRPEKINEVIESLSPKLLSIYRKNTSAQVVSDTEQDPDWVWLEEVAYVRSWIGTPLLVKGKLIGTMNLDSRTPNAYNQQAADTVLAFANQAAIAIETARLFEAERTARERSEALRQAAQVLASSLSLEDVLSAVMEQLGRVVQFDTGGVMLYENDRARFVACRGFERFGDLDRLAKLELDPHGFANMSQVLITGQTLVISDTSVDSRWIEYPGTEHIRSWLGVPLKLRDRLIGLLNLGRVVAGGFGEEEIGLAESFAVHAATAIENARLYEKENRRASQLERLRQASLGLTSSLDLPLVLDTILHTVSILLPNSESMHIFLYDSIADRLSFGAAISPQGRLTQPFREPRQDGLTYIVARSGQTLVIPDMHNHILYQDCPPSWGGAILGMALKIGERVVGVMNVAYSKPYSIGIDDLHLLGLLGDQAAVAIENARLFEQAATERRHLELLFDIGRELASLLDAEEILERATVLTCKALNGQVGQAYRFIPEGERLQLVTLFGCPGLGIEQADRLLDLRTDRSLAGWVVASGEVAVVPDIQMDPRWKRVPEVEGTSRSAICAPILSNGLLLGTITVTHEQPNAFQRDQIPLIQAITRELGLALSNASRYQEVKRRLAEITLIQNLSETFNQRLDLPVLLEEVVVQLTQRLGYRQVEIYTHEGNELVLQAYRGVAPRADRLEIDSAPAGQAVRAGQAILIQPAGTAAELYTPILRMGNVAGVIVIQQDPGGVIDAEDVNLLQMLAGQIAIALENARLYDRVRRHARDLEDTVAQRTAELVELYELSQEIGYQLSYEELLRLLLRRLYSAMHCEVTAGNFQSGDFRGLVVVTGRPLTATAQAEIQAAWQQAGGETPWGEQLRLIKAKDFQEDASPITHLRTALHAPIRISSGKLGVLMAFREAVLAFSAEQERLLNTFANQAGQAAIRLGNLLNAQVKHLENLVEHVPMGILLLDADFNVQVTNPLGRKYVEAINGHIDGHHLTRLGKLTLLELAQRTVDALPFEFNLPRPDRRTFAAQMRRIDGERVQWVLSIQDVTSERENQFRVQSQERLATVGQLASGIAHDFNNIMAAIMVYTELIQGDPNLSGSSRDKLGVIQQQVQRATSLIRQILDFSRRAVIRQSSLDLMPFIKEFEKMLGRILPENIHMELTADADSYWVNADPTRLQQVLMNLAVNARDAMPDGGVLRFELHRDILSPAGRPPSPGMTPGEWVCIKVSDTGVGIPSEALPHVFDPFYTTKPVGQGAGLGLAQVYGIVKQHEGFVDVESELGEGTRFIIHLPLLGRLDPGNEKREEREQMSGRGKRILLVEDDAATRDAIQALLESYHYRVETAANGLAALEKLEQEVQAFDLVISDMVMPRMGGIALYEALQQRSRPLRMLLITGHPLDTQSRGHVSLGQLHWLQKPFTMRELDKALQELFD